LFLTVADYLLNRAPASQSSVFPMAHVFAEQWSHAEQYIDVKVPSPLPSAIVQKQKEAMGDTLLSFVAGEFIATYGLGCPAHRRFDAIVTSFFIDTVEDVAELFSVMDSLLGKGGVWVNVGPLNWRTTPGKSRLFLCWEEVVQIWEGLGYEFVSSSRSECDVAMPLGQMIFTESYFCPLTVAVKR